MGAALTICGSLILLGVIYVALAVCAWLMEKSVEASNPEDKVSGESRT